MITSQELKNLMAYATGTENYYRYNCGNTILITDGVKIFSENAETFWFLNEFCIFMNKWINKDENEYLFTVELISKDDKGKMVIKNGQGNVLYTKHYSYTDCPEGSWKFYYDKDSKVLLWNGEY